MLVEVRTARGCYGMLGDSRGCWGASEMLGLLGDARHWWGLLGDARGC
jgi:hypothetical protein